MLLSNHQIWGQKFKGQGHTRYTVLRQEMCIDFQIRGLPNPRVDTAPKATDQR